uniref:NAC domain-containing protein n=1 Tax=Hordeum vulgare subsp. vulgare TaxID=112509 RepID=A0A8I6YNF0_HORVV
MATAAATHAALRVGMKFNPTPRDAIGFYLRRRVLGQPLPDTAGVIHEARVYGSEPKDLAAAFPRLPGTHERFFFTTCKRQKAGRGYRISRTVGAGGWIPNAKKVVQNDAGETIGFRETLRYSYKDKNRESDWLMEEYHICGLDQFAVVDGEESVLCKVYVLPGLKPGSVTLQQSEAGDSLLAGSGVLGAHATMVAGQQETPRPPQEPRQSQVMQRPAPPRPQEARQPQVIHKPAPPRLQEARQPQVIQKQQVRRALDKRRVAVPATMMTTTSTQQVAKRPAHPIAEPPRPKRIRAAAAAVPASAALSAVNVAVRQAIDGWNSPKRPAFLSAPLPQHHAKATISRRKSNPSLTDLDMDDFARSLETDLDMAADQSTIQQGGHQSTIQEEATQDELASRLEPQPSEVDMSDLLSWFDADAEELPENSEHVQESPHEHQHEHARSLEGLVADERGDDVIAEDLFDALDNIGNDDDLISDSGDKDDWLNLPLSAYSGIMY